MKPFSLKSQLALTASAALLAGLMVTPAYAQDSGNGADTTMKSSQQVHGANLALQSTHRFPSMLFPASSSPTKHLTICKIF